MCSFVARSTRRFRMRLYLQHRGVAARESVRGSVREGPRRRAAHCFGLISRHSTSSVWTSVATTTFLAPPFGRSCTDAIFGRNDHSGKLAIVSTRSALLASERPVLIETRGDR